MTLLKSLFTNYFEVYKKYKASYENPITVMFKAYMRNGFIPVLLKDHYKRIWPVYWVYGYAGMVAQSPEKGEKLKIFYDSIQKPNHPNRDENGEFVEFEYNNYQCRFYGCAEGGRIINGAIEDVFFREDYKFLNPNNSIVIDIGANIGDSAIYFCLNNAERVIALEPYPFSYNYAKINVTANKMNDKIEVLNAGYGKNLEVKVKDKNANGSDILEISNDGKKINIYSLVTLINIYGLDNKDDLLLKMDCEGCEYNLLDEPIEVLRKFKRIEMEFHYGYKNLEKKLEQAGFSVDHSKTMKAVGVEPSLREMGLNNRDLTLGIIYAERDKM